MNKKFNYKDNKNKTKKINQVNKVVVNSQKNKIKDKPNKNKRSNKNKKWIKKQ